MSEHSLVCRADPIFMKITWLGHACFLLEGSKQVLIDPFVPEGTIDCSPDMVAVTHGHADHLGIAEELGCHTICMNELAKVLGSRGLDCDPMNIGGTISYEGVTFTMTQALHSAWFEAEGPGFYGGTAAGFVITMDGVSVYHAGDTGLFSDMKLIRDLYRPDVALLPIGGRFTMGPDEAMIAATFVGAPIVIPMHYNTFPAITQDADAFKETIEKTTNLTVQVLKPGESTTV